ncbi:hypothetical protein GUJ93_ZPchr0012g20837 [Zizania palustris]|uniref:Uncharacterized protein n=1 Tax=Zizania palustris TaxID=103762 RepID=A0A8J5WS14_ZIZPA|nr:hypothetical protein GUJ93_ZPchr0012g20837 [Zizania palustris]
MHHARNRCPHAAVPFHERPVAVVVLPAGDPPPTLLAPGRPATPLPRRRRVELGCPRPNPPPPSSDGSHAGIRGSSASPAPTAPRTPRGTGARTPSPSTRPSPTPNPSISGNRFRRPASPPSSSRRSPLAAGSGLWAGLVATAKPGASHAGPNGAKPWRSAATARRGAVGEEERRAGAVGEAGGGFGGEQVRLERNSAQNASLNRRSGGGVFGR